MSSMLSKSSKYAIKAVIFLALHSDKDRKILVRDMYEAVKVSESYLAKLLQDLSRHGIISSTKGRHGGFYLSEENTQRTLMDIVRVIDGDEGIHACVLGISSCNAENPCVLHHLVGPSKMGFNHVLETTKLGDLVAGISDEHPVFPL